MCSSDLLLGGQTLDGRAVDGLLGRPVARLISGSDLRGNFENNPISIAPETVAESRLPIDLKTMLETMELERIQMALDMADGVISEAARMLTLKRTTLIEKMRKYGVDKTC